MSAKPIIVVTGGGRGIGAAVAKKAAKQGYFVCINYLKNKDAAWSVVDDIEQDQGQAIALPADVSDEQSVCSLFERIDALPGELVALVNNAGMLQTQSRLDQMDAKRWVAVLKQNVVSAFLCSKAAVLRLSTCYGGKGGAIVNVSSASAYLGSANEYIDYAASKGAVDSLTRGLALEVADEGIRVNAVRPALIHTDIHALGGMPDRVDKKKEVIPLKRGGEPDEVADAVMFLLTNQSSFITGTFIDVTGGL